MPPTAAARDHRPTNVAAPTASSPREMATPMETAEPCRCTISAWIGLTRAAEASWDWIDVGFEASKKPGLASFWRPAKTKVPPRKSRSGSNAQPAKDGGRAGGPRRAQTRRHRLWSRGTVPVVVGVRLSLVGGKTHHPLAA